MRSKHKSGAASRTIAGVCRKLHMGCFRQHIKFLCLALPMIKGRKII